LCNSAYPSVINEVGQELGTPEKKINVKYRQRCEGFVELAFGLSAINDKISYPFRDCMNKKNAC